MNTITSIIIFDGSRKPSESKEMNEDSIQDAKIIYSWPPEAPLSGIRAGAIETLLHLTSRFLCPTRRSNRDSKCRQEADDHIAMPGVPLIVQTRYKIIAAEVFLKSVIVCLVCTSPLDSRSELSEKPEQTASTTPAPQGGGMLASLTSTFRKALVGAPSRSSGLQPRQSSSLSSSSGPDVSSSSVGQATLPSHADAVLEVLRRYCRQLELFYGPIEHLVSLLEETPDLQQQEQSTLKQKLLHAFTEKFIEIEQAKIFDLNTQLAGGFNGIQYAPLERIAFLETRRFYHGLATSPPFINCGAHLLGCSLFFKGYYLGGSISNDDIALIYEYLISVPDATVSNLKLLLPPWRILDKHDGERKLHTEEKQMSDSGVNECLYGKVHLLLPVDELSNTLSSVESEATGYLLGLHPLPAKRFEDPMREGEGKIIPPSYSSRLLVPRIVLSDGTRACLLVFMYKGLLTVMLVDRLGRLSCEANTSKSPSVVLHDTQQTSFTSLDDDTHDHNCCNFGYDCPSVDRRLFNWFYSLTRTLLGHFSKEPLGLIRLETMVASYFHRAMSNEDNYQFFYGNRLNKAFRRGNFQKETSKRKGNPPAQQKWFKLLASASHPRVTIGDHLPSSHSIHPQCARWICASKSILHLSSLPLRSSFEKRDGRGVHTPCSSWIHQNALWNVSETLLIKSGRDDLLTTERHNQNVDSLERVLEQTTDQDNPHPWSVRPAMKETNTRDGNRLDPHALSAALRPLQERIVPEERLMKCFAKSSEQGKQHSVDHVDKDGQQRKDDTKDDTKDDLIRGAATPPEQDPSESVNSEPASSCRPKLTPPCQELVKTFEQRLERHQDQLRNERVVRILIRSKDGRWMVGKISLLERFYCVVGDEESDVADAENRFVKETFQNIFI